MKRHEVAAALLRGGGFQTISAGTPDACTILQAEYGVFALRVRLPHGPHSPRRELWFGVCTADRTTWIVSTHCRDKRRVPTMLSMVRETLALGRTLSEIS